MKLEKNVHSLLKRLRRRSRIWRSLIDDLIPSLPVGLTWHKKYLRLV